MKIIVFIALALVSTLSMAHSGHGEGSASLHDFEHALWLSAGAIIFVLAYGIYALKKK